MIFHLFVECISILYKDIDKIKGFRGFPYFHTPALFITRKGKSILVNARVMSRGDLILVEGDILDLLTERVYPASGGRGGVQIMPSSQGSTVKDIPSIGEGFHVS